MRPSQLSLLEPVPALPAGLRYRTDLISATEEREFVRQLGALPFQAFEFQGYLGKRRVISFRWRYDFNRMQIQRTEDIPSFLLGLRERAAAFAGLASADLQQVLLTEYAPDGRVGVGQGLEARTLGQRGWRMGRQRANQSVKPG